MSDQALRAAVFSKIVVPNLRSLIPVGDVHWIGQFLGLNSLARLISDFDDLARNNKTPIVSLVPNGVPSRTDLLAFISQMKATCVDPLWGIVDFPNTAKVYYQAISRYGFSKAVPHHIIDFTRSSYIIDGKEYPHLIASEIALRVLFREAGYGKLELFAPSLKQDLEGFESGFWDILLENPPFMFFKARSHDHTQEA